MKPYYSWCSCHKQVGETDGAVLIIGGWEIRRPVTLWCGCGAATHWRPIRRREQEPAPIYVPAAACYTEAVEV